MGKWRPKEEKQIVKLLKNHKADLGQTKKTFTKANQNQLQDTFISVFINKTLLMKIILGILTKNSELSF